MRTALELIGQSGMGYSFAALADNQEEHPYLRAMKRFILLIRGLFCFFTNRFVSPLAAKFNFPHVKRYIVEHILMRKVQEIKESVDLIYRNSLEIIKAKEDAINSSDPTVVQEMKEKKDIISILMRANSQANRLSDEELYGQVSTFVFVGIATTSSGIERIIRMLTTHSDVQKRLLEELREAQQDDQLTYDQLMSLPHLDAVCCETLHEYPPINLVPIQTYPPVNLVPIQTVRKDIMLPLSKPIIGSDGREVSEVLVPKGTDVVISILGSNTNPDLWSADALEWKTEW
ncbi:Cytochrome P450 4F22 [Leucoagaricus sp. SymC.cos]|nr:Cytochrome P450 4F22 [Leucoagaricus sp. SymC.cos]